MLKLDDSDILVLVTEVANLYGVDPLSSIESEAFFNDMLLSYNGSIDHESLTGWLNNQVSTQFIAIGERPRWIQARDWQFADGKPMIFAGQIDISKSSFPTFHDDTSLYVFIARKQEPKVVMQQY